MAALFSGKSSGKGKPRPSPKGSRSVGRRGPTPPRAKRGGLRK